jgi:hypothetical protein
VIWATRPHCHVDRTACAWLIKRFIDPQAEFVFVAELVDVPTDATPFDMRGAELSHHDGDCSFERFLDSFDLDDPALDRIAQIVHEADIGDQRFEAPEAPGLELAIRALGNGRDDLALFHRTNTLFEGMYATFSQVAT